MSRVLGPPKYSPMSEEDWLEAGNPTPMVAYLLGTASDRKLRLFAAACCARLSRADEDRQAVDVGERFADGRATEEERRACYDAIQEQKRLAIDVQNFHDAARLWGRQRPVMREMNAAVGLDGLARSLVDLRSIDLLRCIFGNPFQPPYGSAWDNVNAARLAHAIYEDRAFDRLPILADALEEAGCQDTLALEHCREGAVHTRGCWVLDRLLGKT